MEILERMPWLAKDAVFQRLASIAEVAAMSMDDRRKYDESLRKYRDTISVMEGQYQEGWEKGLAEGEAKGLAKGEAKGRAKETAKCPQPQGERRSPGHHCPQPWTDRCGAATAIVRIFVRFLKIFVPQTQAVTDPSRASDSSNLL